MGQTLRSQVYNQMTQDVNNTINGAVNAMDSLSRLKQTYDYSFQKQIDLESQRADQERKEKILMSNNPDDWNAADQEYFTHMADYMDQIKAPQTVRNKWNNETLPLQKAQIRQQRFVDEAKLYATDAVTKWNAFVDTVGSNGDLDLEGKREELTKYWSEAGLGNLPTSLTGKITTVDDALKAMEGSIAVQYVDRYYASLPGGVTPDSFNPSELAEKAVADLEKQLGKTLDVSTRYTYLEAAKKQINAHEASALAEVQTQQGQFAMAYREAVRQGGEMSDADLFALASEYGAVNPDGSLNKYWSSWFGNNMNILVALADYEKVMDAVIKNDPQKEWENVLSSYGVSKGEIRAEEQAPGSVKADVSYSIVNNDGSLNWTNSSGKKTYSFSDGSSVTTEWAPVVQYALNQLGISSDSKDAVVAVVNLVQAEGMAGRFEDGNVVKIVNELRDAKANPEVTELEYQNMVMGYITNGWITQQDANDLDLWNVDTKQFQKMPVYSSIKNEIESMVVSEFGNKESQKYENNRIVSQVMQEAERLYNANPGSFTPGSPSYTKAVEEAYKRVVHEKIDNQVSQAINVFLTGGLRDAGRFLGGIINSDLTLAASQRKNVQSIVRGFYDPADSNYGLFHYMADDIQESANEKASAGYGSLDELQNEVATVYGENKTFNDLTDTQKEKVKLTCLRIMYEKDVKDVVMKAFNITDLNDVEEKYIYGIGPMFVNKRTGEYYATDGDPNTTSMYYTGILTKSQMAKDRFEIAELQGQNQSIEKRVHRVGGNLKNVESDDYLTTGGKGSF